MTRFCSRNQLLVVQPEIVRNFCTTKETQTRFSEILTNVMCPKISALVTYQKHEKADILCHAHKYPYRYSITWILSIIRISQGEALLRWRFCATPRRTCAPRTVKMIALDRMSGLLPGTMETRAARLISSGSSGQTGNDSKLFNREISDKRVSDCDSTTPTMHKWVVYNS